MNSGNFKLNASNYLEGHDILICMVSGSVTWNGGATVKLYAPETDPYKGLLLYLSFTNSSAITINGNSFSAFEATIMAPAPPIEIKGTWDAGIVGQIIGYIVDLGGTSGINIHFDASKVTHLLSAPSLELKH